MLLNYVIYISFLFIFFVSLSAVLARARFFTFIFQCFRFDGNVEPEMRVREDIDGPASLNNNRCIANDQLFYLLIQMIRLCSMNENLFFRSSFVSVYLLVSSALLSSLISSLIACLYIRTQITNESSYVGMDFVYFLVFSCVKR